MLFRCFLTKILSSPPMIAFELMQQWCDEKNSSLSPDMLWQLLGDLWSCQAVTSMSNPLLLTNHKTADQSKFNTVISICWKKCRRSKFSLCLRTTVHWKVGRNLYVLCLKLKKIVLNHLDLIGEKVILIGIVCQKTVNAWCNILFQTRTTFFKSPQSQSPADIIIIIRMHG